MAAKAGDGKKVVFNVTFALNILSFIFFFISFASPYWFQSWPRVYSPFKKIGLWEACFAGLVLPMDLTQKAYHGCWWILATEFKDIRSWIMPGWFITTQVFCTVVFCLMVVNLIVLLYIWITISSDNKTGTGKKRANIKIIQTSTACTIIEAIFVIFVVLLFGIMVYRDRNWMPNPDLNYLSWSYGFIVITGFFLIFSSIAQIIYTKLERAELRVPPTPAGMAMVHQVKDSSL